MTFAAIQSIQSYKTDLSKYSSWNSIDIKNKKLASLIKDKYYDECTIYSSNIGVRAYSNLLFHSGIYEGKSITDATRLMKEKMACRNIYLESKFIYPDLPDYTKATIFDSNGNVTVISTADIK